VSLISLDVSYNYLCDLPGTLKVLSQLTKLKQLTMLVTKA
jgi:hypothetical protein